jgi:PleD family two-component response regulator
MQASRPARHAGRRVHRQGIDAETRKRSLRKTMAKSIVLKDVQSPERLLDETALFLHRVVTDLPPSQAAHARALHSSDEALRGRKVLVVDDDARNIFALTSVLERHEMEVSARPTAGRPSTDRANAGPRVVLMDIMMPEMDGYETMREIRSIPRSAPCRSSP